MNKHVLVIGERGWVGSQLMLYFSQVSSAPVFSSAVRLGAPRWQELLTAEIKANRIDRVIVAVGRTCAPLAKRDPQDKSTLTIDYLERGADRQAWRENLEANLYVPVAVAQLCVQLHVHCTVIGTGCIFTSEYEQEEEESKTHAAAAAGNAVTLFDEHSEPNFFGSNYSLVKGFTDRILGNMSPKYVLNVRIRMPFQAYVGVHNRYAPNADTDTYNLHDPRDFIVKLAQYPQLVNIQNSVSVLGTLFPALRKAIMAGMGGTLNLTNPGTISHHEIMDMYREIVDPSHTYESLSLEDQAKLIKGDRSNNQLDTKLLQVLDPSVPTAREAVKGAMEKLAQARFEYGVE